MTVTSDLDNNSVKARYTLRINETESEYYEECYKIVQVVQKNNNKII